MRSLRINPLGPESSDRCPLRERRGMCAIQRHGEMASDSEGGGWSDVAAGQGTPGAIGRHCQETRKEPPENLRERTALPVP